MHAMLKFGAAALVFFFALAAHGAGDSAAPKGMKHGKIVYDITEGDGKLLLDRLVTVEETRQTLIEQGVKPHFVISFRGPATKLVQKDMEKVKPEDRQYAAQIATALAQMGKAPGMESLEQCAVAIRHAGTRAEDVVAPLKVVANSYVSIMAYESKGYAYIRP